MAWAVPVRSVASLFRAAPPPWLGIAAEESGLELPRRCLQAQIEQFQMGPLGSHTTIPPAACRCRPNDHMPIAEIGNKSGKMAPGSGGGLLCWLATLEATIAVY